MRQQQLRRIFQLTLASVGSTAGCSPSQPPAPTPYPITSVVAVPLVTPPPIAPAPSPPAPRAPTQRFLANSICEDPAAPNPLANLKPSVPADYVEVRRVMAMDGSQQAVHRAGFRCAGADANSPCEQAYAQLQLKEGFVSNCIQVQCSHHVIYTHGDKLRVISTKEDFKTFLGAIDSKGEALLWLWANRYDTTDCNGFAQGGLTETKTGFEVKASKLVSDCPWTTHDYRLAVAHDGTISVVRDLGKKKSNMCAGRMPACFRRVPSSPQAPPAKAAAAAPGARFVPAVVTHLAEMAVLESAAVVAFEQLAVELEAHRAPVGLIAAARAAADDERHHARVIKELALQLGATVDKAQMVLVPPRSLFDMALENVQEGCVRETYGALLGQYQYQHSDWPAFADAMRTIAADEFRHALFSWQLSDWLQGQLNQRQRQQLRAAQQRAVATLLAPQPSPPANDVAALASALGYPPPRAAHTLAQALAEQLWQADAAA